MRRFCRTHCVRKPVTAKIFRCGERETMAGEDQERLEDLLALERYIEELQESRVAHVPAELTPDLARIYRMAMSFHAASTGAAAARPEFIAELQAKLTQVKAIRRVPLKQHRPCTSKE